MNRHEWLCFLFCPLFIFWKENPRCLKSLSHLQESIIVNFIMRIVFPFFMISLYQSMLHKSYRELYHDHSITSKYLKNLYHTNDYFPLSAISEAKGILKSQKTWYKKNISLKKNQLSKRGTAGLWKEEKRISPLQ